MKTKEKGGTSANELQFELKYCERCGGLWLRPAGGEQIYCVACGRGIAEMPPASRELRGATMPVGAQWGADEDDFEECERDEDCDPDEAGGAA